MEETKKLTRRQFAATLAAAAATPMLFRAAPLPAQEKKDIKLQRKPDEPAPEPTPEERRERALKQIREFKVPDGAEPAFAFRADW
ncbi:MAG: hypothetical protein ACRD4T_00400 [Candidatus Acidiferrales bacterium]